MKDGMVEDFLCGREAEVVVSEPWDLVGSDGSNRFMATIADVDMRSPSVAECQRALVQLRSTLIWKGRPVDYFVAEARRGHAVIDDLTGGQVVECNAIAVSVEDVAHGILWETDKWRGGNLGAIVTVRLMPA